MMSTQVSNNPFYEKFKAQAALAEQERQNAVKQSSRQSTGLKALAKATNTDLEDSDSEDYNFKIDTTDMGISHEAPITPAKTGMYESMKKKGKEVYDTMIHPALKDIVKRFEGLRTEAYLPTKNDVPTIGYGMTKGVKLGDKITPEQADKMLEAHLAEYQKQVKSLVKVPLTDNQLNALTSLVYNVGPTAFRKSKALAALNAGDFETFQHEAFDPEQGFVRQKGEILTGLVNRRQDEKELFNA